MRWLTWWDSNHQIPKSILTFETTREFGAISIRCGPRDFLAKELPDSGRTPLHSGSGKEIERADHGWS